MSALNEAWQRRDDWLTRDTETTSEVVPECDAEFGARLGQSEEGIAAVTSEIAAGSSADFTPCYLTSDVVFGAIGMQRDFRPLQDPQQFVLVGRESCQQAIQGDEAGALAEDAIKAQPQGAAAFCGGRQAICFQIGIEAPDQSADTLLAARCWSVKVSSLWTSRSACTQHSACKPMLNWPASSLSTTVSRRNSCA